MLGRKRRYCRMATKSVITKIRRKKMAEASHTTGSIAKITHIALGSGGVNADGTVIVPLAENVALKNEVVRKPYTSSTKTSDTSYEYTIKLEENELVGTFISEMALIDEDGDVVAFSNFLAKGKDETEVTFTIEDNY
ncbi:phage tail protein [Lachnospiraceae bacterium 47-T17]